MRRRDREILDPQEILAMLTRCDTVRLGIADGETPYVVPLSFGVEAVADHVRLYVHSARQGRKVELLKRHPRVFVEADRFFCVQEVGKGITTRYESVMGTGLAEELTYPVEIEHGLRLLLAHYGQESYPLANCQGTKHIRVYRVTLDALTGKRNPVA